MTCAEVQALLPDLVDGTLDAFLASDVERHMLTCPECAREVNELRELFIAMEKSRPVRPSIALRDNFLKMVEEETAAQEASKRRTGGQVVRMSWFSALGKTAVAAAILLAGMLIGYRLHTGTDNSKELGDLKTSLKEMKETLMINMLDNESASERIKAVNYAEEIPTPNQRVINALVNTLNSDKSVNVRLAALYSLARYNDNRAVTDSLVNSLGRQTEPIIQIVLINILGERKETKAIQPMRNLIEDQKTLKEVKDMARKELNKL